MKLLFLCSRNQWRSPTAEALFRGSDTHEARSAGTSDSARVRVGPKLLAWADRIYVMERKHLAILRRRFPDVRAPIVVLDIPDDFQRDDPELVALLTAKLAELL